MIRATELSSFARASVEYLPCVNGHPPPDALPSMPDAPLVSHIFTADPSAHVFDGRIYIYPSHDLADDLPENDLGDHYGMTDYHVLSQDNPEAPGAGSRPGAACERCAVGLATDVGAGRGLPERALLPLFPAKDKEGIFRIGVATSARPEGPFKAEPAPIKGSFSIDPCVFQAADGEFYIVFGGIWGGQLQRWASGRYDANARERQGDEVALTPKIARLTPDMLQFATPPQDAVITGADGNPCSLATRRGAISKARGCIATGNFITCRIRPATRTCSCTRPARARRGRLNSGASS